MNTATATDTKTLLKILIGAAWLDGSVQPEERDYLRRVAQEHDLASAPEIYPLLNELRPVAPEECYLWVAEYLGQSPSTEKCQDLIEAISGLIYSDGNVDNAEAKLLNTLQHLDPAAENKHPESSAVIKAVRRLYQHWVQTLS
jgi:uncharacterized tellurite resistance protein B-like protein